MVISCLLALLLAAAPTAAQAQHVQVIVSADSPILELSEQDVRQIFTARRLRLGDQRLTVAVNPGDADVYERLARTLTGRSARAFGLLWLQAGFQQAAPEPKVVEDDADMIRYVLSTPGAVGYVSPADLPDGVRVVHRLLLDQAIR